MLILAVILIFVGAKKPPEISRGLRFRDERKGITKELGFSHRRPLLTVRRQ